MLNLFQHLTGRCTSYMWTPFRWDPESSLGWCWTFFKQSQINTFNLYWLSGHYCRKKC